MKRETSILTTWGKWLSAQLEIARPGQQTNTAMEGVRGVAILLVFLTHYAEFNIPDKDASQFIIVTHQFLLRAGLCGVDLFFVLSGYLIYGSIIHKPIKPLKYAKRRIQRIYPVFTFTLLVYVALSIAIPTRSKLTGTLEQDIYLVALNFLLLPLLPFMGGVKTIINATWSLAYEIFYYIAAPLMIYALNLRALSPNIRLAAITSLSAAGFIAFHYFGGNDRAMMFVSGVLVYELLQREYRFVFPRWLGCAALFAGAAILGIFYDISGFPTLTLFLLFSFFCLDAFTPGSHSSKWLSIQPLRQLGNISYSFYLMHGLLLQAFLSAAKFTPLKDNFFLPLIPALFFCIAGSILVYLAIEKPLSLSKAKDQPTPRKGPAPCKNRGSA